MTNRLFYEMSFGKKDWPYWHLDDGKIDKVDGSYVKVDEPGPSVKINFRLHDTLVICEDVSEAIAKIVNDDEIKRTSIKIEGDNNLWETIEICNFIDCIDEGKSLFRLHHAKPSKNPPDSPHYKKYEMINKFVIDPEKVKDHHIFYFKHWPMIIVDDKIKNVIDSFPRNGVVFKLISPEY